VHRDKEPGFTPSEGNRLADGVGGTGYDDFSALPGRRYVYRVRAVNPFDLTSPFAEVEVTTPLGGLTYTVIDVTGEQSVVPPMTLRVDPGSGRTHLSAEGGGTALVTPPSQGEAAFRVLVERAGEYAIWGLVHAPDQGRDSFHVAVDVGAGGQYRIWHTGVHPTWGWSRALQSVHLDVGEHTVTVKHREPGTRLAALMLTTDLEFEPAGG
jgi:hypothetical protein